MTPEFLIYIFPYAEFLMGLIFIFTGLLIALFFTALVANMIKSAIGDNPADKKKTYNDEMSIYDNKEVKEVTRLPYQTGVSLSSLINSDGEIPDEAYHQNETK